MSAGEIPICVSCGLAMYPGYHHNHYNEPLVLYTMLDLFVDGQFTSHSGLELDYKIVCEALSDSTIETMAKIISKKIRFSTVYGIPTGGERLAKALDKYTTENSCFLVVDDVFTTGNSMEKARKDHGMLYTLGAVIFARAKCPDWIQPILSLNSYFN